MKRTINTDMIQPLDAVTMRAYGPHVIIEMPVFFEHKACGKWHAVPWNGKCDEGYMRSQLRLLYPEGWAAVNEVKDENV